MATDRELDLTGRRALVTGASRGLGRHIATILAHHGARVAVHCRAAEHDARDVVAHLHGDGHVILSADLAHAEEAAALPGRAAEALGGLDIVVNNAGIYEHMPRPGKSPEHWRHLWERIVAIKCRTSNAPGATSST